MKHRIPLALTLILVVLAAAAGLFGGYRWGASSAEPVSEELTQTFYATISEVQDNRLLVEGLEVNDINHRGAFTVPVDSSTRITWRYEDMDFSELRPGQTVSVTYSGAVLESDPAQLTKTDWIQLLDDEK